MGSKSSRIKIPKVGPIAPRKRENEPVVENLVFEGGGVLGIAYLGAIGVLHDEGLLDGITRYAGTSAGAIYATILAVGYTPAETRRLIYGLDFSKLLNKKCILVDLINLFKKYGYCDGSVCSNLIKDCIKGKTGNPDLTFKELYDKYGRELVIIGCNLNRLKEVEFSHENTPNMPIHKAVLISMSSPFVFKPVELDGDLYVDGGVVNNYPIHAFKNIEKTIGLKLLSRSEKETENIFEGYDKVSNIAEYSTTLIRALSVANERNSMRENYWERTISIKTGNLGAMDFDITNENKNYLISNGKQAAEEFIRDNL